MRTIFENKRSNVIGGQTRRLIVSAEGDDKSSVVEQYSVTVQNPGMTSRITMDRKTAMDVISDLMYAMHSMEKHWAKKNGRGGNED